MKISLENFIERSNKHTPVGYINNKGLTSSMFNPLYEDFYSSLIVDFRPRDNWPHSGAYEESFKYLATPIPTVTVSKILAIGITANEGVYADWILGADENVTRIQFRDPTYVTINNPLDLSGKNFVAMAAIKIKDIVATGSQKAFPFGFFDNTLSSFLFAADIGFQRTTNVFYQASVFYGGSFKPFLDPTITTYNLDRISSDSLDKWVLLQFVGSPNSSNPLLHDMQVRAIGGQFGSEDSPDEMPSSFTVDLAGSDTFLIPLKSDRRVAFASIAVYEDTNDAESAGTAIDDINWILFEPVQVCQSVDVKGKKLTFEVGAGEIAWELKVNNQWINTDGSNGEDNRVFYETGTHSITTNFIFTSIRPILKNSGFLNAETNALLLSIDVEVVETEILEISSVTKEKVLFCYRAFDEDSYEIAQYYKEKRGLTEDQLIPLPCNNTTILESLSEYQTQIEQPLLQWLETNNTSSDALSHESSSGLSEAWVIILGFNIPHAFYTDSYEKIAVASRIHRIKHDHNYKYPNYIYNRRNFRFFTSEDAEQLLITAVIDAPTKEKCKKLIDRAIDVSNQTFITGKVYVDPFGKKESESDIVYQNDILDFIDNESNVLGLDFVQTVDNNDPYREPIISILNNDSFYWGWYNPTFSRSLFSHTNNRRCFLYNADDESADYIKQTFSDSGSDPWIVLAINSEPGYAASACSISYPGNDSYLRPRPFFESLQQGSTLGEAFLHSCPYVDWRIILVGDPLTTIKFPDQIPIEQEPSNVLLPNNEVILRVITELEKSVAFLIRQSNLLNDLVNSIVQSSDMQEEIALLYPVNKWNVLKNRESRYEVVSESISALARYVQITTRMNIDQWLTTNQYKTSQYLRNAINSISSTGISVDNIKDEGYWEFDFTYNHNLFTYEEIHFVLNVSTDIDFNNIIIDKNTLNSIDNWSYEKELHVFHDFPENGMTSNYSGRRIKYISQIHEYLDSLNIFYVRWKPINEFAEEIEDWQYSNLMVIRY